MTSHPAPPPAVVMKPCVICKTQKAEYLTIFGKVNCIECLSKKYVADELFSDDGRAKVEWSAQMISEVYAFLNARLPEDQKQIILTTIKLPMGTFVCLGRNEIVTPGYPSQGHISGNLNKCMEDGCPTHALCKTCAAALVNCPQCQAFIRYEELPIACPPDCSCHKPSFTEACPTCQKVTPRKKQQP